MKLKIVFVGVAPDLEAIIRSHLTDELVAGALEAQSPTNAGSLLVNGEANCVFIDILTFPWAPTEYLLHLCTRTFPVCVVRQLGGIPRSAEIPRKWLERLEDYHFIEKDAGLEEIGSQIDRAIRSCHRYQLKKMIQVNLRSIATEPLSSPEVQVKAQQIEDLLLIEKKDKSEFADGLGLNAAQMRSLFNDTLDNARRASKVAEQVNLAAVCLGLTLVATTACAGLFQSANAWTFATGGMGAAATIAALITSPSRRIGSSASQLIYVQTAYFSFLTQVRMLVALSPETVIQRSERLDVATSKLLGAC